MEKFHRCFESWPKERRSDIKINFEEVEIVFCEDRQNDTQNDFHRELVKINIEERASEALVDSDAEDKGAIDDNAVSKEDKMETIEKPSHELHNSQPKYPVR